jgi:hypothetical protein
MGDLQDSAHASTAYRNATARPHLPKFPTNTIQLRVRLSVKDWPPIPDLSY